MKKSVKITLSGVFAALSAAFMLLSFFPYLTYAIPAVSGLFIMIILIEVGIPYAIGGYAVSAVLSLLLAEKESAALYLCLFGFYPIVKAVVERIKKPPVEWIIKILIFNICVLLAYLVTSFVMGIGYDDINGLFKYSAYAFLFVCNVAFVLYDIAISRVAVFYIYRLHPKVNAILKK